MSVAAVDIDNTGQAWTFLQCPTVVDILGEVARKHGTTVVNILSERRDEDTVCARQEVMWRCCHETPLSLAAIGRILRRDHSSVLHGSRRHAARMKEEAQ